MKASAEKSEKETKNQRTNLELVFSIIIVILLIGVLIWNISDKNSGEEAPQATAEMTEDGQLTEPDTDAEITDSEYSKTEIRFLYPNFQETAEPNVAVTYPKTWSVETVQNNGDPELNPRNRILLTSPGGYTVSINDADGIGYVCNNSFIGSITYRVEDIIKTETQGLSFYHIIADTYLEQDPVDSYVLINDTLWDATENPIVKYAVGEEFERVYESGAFTCTPLEGPKGYSLPSGGSINIAIDAPDHEGIRLFDTGFAAEFLELEPDLRTVIESIKISE